MAVTEAGASPGAGAGRGANGIFISYRRGDTNGQAHALRDRLVQKYGAKRVFMDVDAIVPGENFRLRIEKELDSSGVMLVIIGRDWSGDGGGQRRIDDPGDFIRREVGSALQRGIPTIPVLVEGTVLPEAGQLPEELRPLVWMQAVNLSNTSWDYDITRVVKAVATHIDDRPKPRRRPRPYKALAAGGVVAIAVAALLVFVLHKPAQPHKPPTNPTPHPVQLSAASAVAAVNSPDRLAAQLVDTGFTAADLPGGSSASAPGLSAGQTALSRTGLVAVIDTRIAGPAAAMWINEYVFDNPGDASSYYATSTPAPAGDSATGSFTTTGVGDATKCQAARAATAPQLAWGCLTLSSTVVSYSALTEYSGSGAGLESALARDAVRHLTVVAGSTPRGLSADPPGQLAPGALFSQLSESSFPSALVPVGLSSPKLGLYSNGQSSPTGMTSDNLGHNRVVVTFTGPDYGDETQYYVFDNASDAQSWFGSGLRPIDTAGNPDQATSTNVNPSGFTSSQRAECGTYTQPSVSGSPAVGISVCYVLWGDVIASGESRSTSDTKAGNSNLALTLAHAALLRVAAAMQPLRRP